MSVTLFKALSAQCEDGDIGGVSSSESLDELVCRLATSGWGRRLLVRSMHGLVPGAEGLKDRNAALVVRSLLLPEPKALAGEEETVLDCEPLDISPFCVCARGRGSVTRARGPS